MMIQFLAVIGGGVTALIVVPVDDNDFLVLRIAGNAIAGFHKDFSVASLWGCWRIIDHHIMYESDIQIVNTRKLRETQIDQNDKYISAVWKINEFNLT